MEQRSAAVSCRKAASFRLATVTLAGAVEPKSMRMGVRSRSRRMLCGCKCGGYWASCMWTCGGCRHLDVPVG